MQDLTEKIAVITGGASGIGLATARRLAREKMRIVLAIGSPHVRVSRECGEASVGSDDCLIQSCRQVSIRTKRRRADVFGAARERQVTIIQVPHEGARPEDAEFGFVTESVCLSPVQSPVTGKYPKEAGASGSV